MMWNLKRRKHPEIELTICLSIADSRSILQTPNTTPPGGLHMVVLSSCLPPKHQTPPQQRLNGSAIWSMAQNNVSEVSLLGGGHAIELSWSQTRSIDEGSGGCWILQWRGELMLACETRYRGDLWLCGERPGPDDLVAQDLWLGIVPHLSDDHVFL